MDLESILLRIENRLSSIEAALKIEKAREQIPVPLESPQFVSTKKSEEPINSVLQESEEPINPVMLWLQDNWLSAIGILLVIMAGGWFVSHAFANNWIDETGRVLVSLATGLGIYALGIWMISKHPRGGLAFIILGAAIALLALFAASQYYHILSASYAFAFMTVIAVGTTVVAVLKGSEGLAIVSTMMMMFVPFMIDSAYSDKVFLLSYVAVVDIATLFIWFKKEWGWPLQLAWAATGFYSIALLQITSYPVVCLFIAVFYLRI